MSASGHSSMMAAIGELAFIFERSPPAEAGGRRGHPPDAVSAVRVLGHFEP
jgi:hypothetical protein